jgi:hypothetical protein
LAPEKRSADKGKPKRPGVDPLFGELPFFQQCLVRYLESQLKIHGERVKTARDFLSLRLINMDKIMPDNELKKKNH